MLYVRETLDLELLRLLLDHLSAQHSTGDETLERGGVTRKLLVAAHSCSLLVSDL